MAALCERGYPYALALVAAALCFCFDPTPPRSTVDLLAAVISVASISVGFLAAAQAIILSMDDNRIVVQLRQAGGYETLLQYFHEAIGLSFAVAAISAIGLFKDFDTFHWHRGMEATWVFFAVAAAMSYHRVTRVFFKILRSPR